MLLFPSMERALSLAEEPEVVADIWYNLGHIGINLGEFNCATMSQMLIMIFKLNYIIFNFCIQVMSIWLTNVSALLYHLIIRTQKVSSYHVPFFMKLI